MTRTKKMLIAALAVMLFTGVAVGAEIVDTTDRAANPEPIPTQMETFQGEAMGRGDCPEPKATDAKPVEEGLSVTCDRHVVTTVE